MNTPGLRTGFTLIEVMVALLLTGLVALLAHALFSGVMSAADSLRRADERPDGRVAARSWLLDACRSLEVGTPGTHGFEGTSDHARFDARLVGPDGWVEQVPVRLIASHGVVKVNLPWLTASVADSTDDATIDYLTGGRGGEGWMIGWTSPVSAPPAIRIRWQTGTRSDTLLCVVGARG